jgi:hypothetical protein
MTRNPLVGVKLVLQQEAARIHFQSAIMCGGKKKAAIT